MLGNEQDIDQIVTGINKTTHDTALSYDAWGSACLDDAVGELECQGRRVVADRLLVAKQGYE